MARKYNLKIRQFENLKIGLTHPYVLITPLRYVLRFAPFDVLMC